MKITISRLMSFLMISLLALLLSACSGSDSSSSSSDSTSGSGSLSLNITDAPVDGLKEVWVTFTKVIIHPADGEEFEVCVPYDEDVECVEGAGMTINLLNLTAGDSERLLDDYPLPAGDYSWMRLDIDPDKTTVVCEETPYDCHDYSVSGSGKYPEREPYELLLDCSSCDQSHLKLNKSFTITDDGWVEFTIDFDLRKSVTLTQPNNTPYKDGHFKLRPTLRITETALASTYIYGTIDEALVDPATPDQCAVYVYEEDVIEPIVPDDICVIENATTCPGWDASTPNPNRPLTTTGVELDSDTGLYNYRTGYLEPGTYTVALLCEYDDPELDDVDVGAFIGEETFEAAPGRTEHNFVAP